MIQTNQWGYVARKRYCVVSRNKKSSTGQLPGEAATAAREEVLTLQADAAQRESVPSSPKQRLAEALPAKQGSERLVPASPLPLKAALSREARVARLDLVGCDRVEVSSPARQGLHEKALPVTPRASGGTSLRSLRSAADYVPYAVPYAVRVRQPRRSAMQCLTAPTACPLATWLRTPPPAEMVTSYALGRVFAVVTGVLGRRQALGVQARLCSWRRRPTVADLQDYEAFCNSSATEKCRSLQLLSPEQRVSVIDYQCLWILGHPTCSRRGGHPLGSDSPEAMKILPCLTDAASLTVQDVVGGASWPGLRKSVEHLGSTEVPGGV
ncbi:adenylyltransferase and sulfurtransferase MOCS3 [Camelus ferus]|nr:adenylyltransferase and sulfurtransferase MOCS3 [Camelus ferus]